MSPQYPEPYPKKADCLWKIVVNVGSIIRATFSDVDLEAHSTCMLDYIEVSFYLYIQFNYNLQNYTFSYLTA